jgi:hypothetical protein|tara:strand:- start:264 stop:1310 length:1047 start_codon:yes stop_codon:yes gene_type:complete
MSLRAAFITSAVVLAALAVAIPATSYVYRAWIVAESAERPGTLSPSTWQRELRSLHSLPYVDVVSAKGQDEVGVTVIDRARAQPGYNLYCSRITNDVLLEDLDGRVVNTWAFPEGNPPPKKLAGSLKGIIVTAILVGDGRLLALRRSLDLTLFTWEGEILWQKEIKGHHELVSPGDGTAFLLTHRRKEYRNVSIDSPSITQIALEDGSILDKWSAGDHLEEIRQMLGENWMLDGMLDYREAALAAGEDDRLIAAHANRDFGLRVKDNGKNVDLFHANTISLVPVNPLTEKSSTIRPGCLLLCFRNLNTIALLDWAKKNSRGIGGRACCSTHTFRPCWETVTSLYLTTG